MESLDEKTEIKTKIKGMGGILVFVKLLLEQKNILI
jgi:hypothetical protein